MFNEMYVEGRVRPEYETISNWIQSLGADSLHVKRAEAERLARKIGITFAVYGDGVDLERLIPFDIIPRVFNGEEWRLISNGVIQRARALNAFLADAYSGGEIFRAGVMSPDLVRANSAYEHQMAGFKPPRGVYAHVIGVDLVRTGADEFFVLEDNCRTPSGVSYMLENREMTARILPEIFAGRAVAPVDAYPSLLLKMLRSMAPELCEQEPTVVVLTPGRMNSAYYEHAFLADQMGVELVEGVDLFTENSRVWMRTTAGAKQVDVIYRRIDDAFIDPLCFRSDSVLGVPGLMGAYRAGGVALVNAPGAGLADDKAIYAHVPDMIQFYLGETPLIPNVQTWKCAEPDSLSYVLDHLEDLVVKEVHGSGGYGMLIGPKSTVAEREAYALRIRKEPEAFIAQPTLALSATPALVEEGVAPRHVDFRPFVLCGEEYQLSPGGLTRVALKEGSLVVNSSQGGGVKDTWVLLDG